MKTCVEKKALTLVQSHDFDDNLQPFTIWHVDTEDNGHHTRVCNLGIYSAGMSMGIEGHTSRV
jgi:hypothetical protein